MNAAFAIGRVSDIDTGRSKLLSLPDSEKMVNKIIPMSNCQLMINPCLQVYNYVSHLFGLFMNCFTNSRLLQRLHIDCLPTFR